MTELTIIVSVFISSMLFVIFMELRELNHRFDCLEKYVIKKMEEDNT